MYDNHSQYYKTVLGYCWIQNIDLLDLTKFGSEFQTNGLQKGTEFMPK